MEIGVRGRRTRARDFEADGGTTSTAVKRRRRLFEDSEDEERGVSLPKKGFSREFVSPDNDIHRLELRTDDRLFLQGDRCHSLSSAVRDPGAASMSSCSSYGSSEKGNEEVTVDVETTNFSCKNSETTLHKEDSSGVPPNTKRSDVADELPAVESSRRSISDKNKQMVSEAELEDFFSAAEKERHNNLSEFTKKYNFDFSKEEPLEGRYEWIRLNK